MRRVSQKKWLWIMGAVFWTGALTALAWACLGVEKALVERYAVAEKTGLRPIANEDGESSTPALDQFALARTLRLQRPIYDPPPPTVTPPPKPEPPPLNVRLLGTMRESSRLVAMFSVPPGSICIREAGQTVDAGSGEAKIIRIETNRVVLEYGGEERVLGMDDGT